MGTTDEPGLWRGIALVTLVIAVGGMGAMLSPFLDMPPSDASAGEFSAYYADERGGLLALCWTATLSMSVLIAFFVALRQLLAGSSPTLANVGLAAGIGTCALTVAGFALFAGVAYRDGTGAETARVLTDVGWVLINLAAGPPTTVSIGAFTWALWRSPYGRVWLLAVGIVVAAAHLVVAGAFAREGFLSPEGTVAYAVPILFFAWIASAAVVLLRASEATPPAGSPAR